MAKVFQNIMMNVSVPTRQRLDALKSRTGKSLTSLVEEAVEELAQKKGITDPDGPEEIMSPFDQWELEKTDNTQTPAKKTITTSFSDWLTSAGPITIQDLNDLEYCAVNVPGTKGRFTSRHVKCEKGNEVHIDGSSSNAVTLRLANHHAAYSFRLHILTERKKLKEKGNEPNHQVDTTLDNLFG